MLSRASLVTRGHSSNDSSNDSAQGDRLKRSMLRNKSSIDELAQDNKIEDVATASNRARRLALQRSGLAGGGGSNSTRARQHQRKQGFLMKQGPLKVLSTLRTVESCPWHPACSLANSELTQAGAVRARSGKGDGLCSRTVSFLISGAPLRYTRRGHETSPQSRQPYGAVPMRPPSPHICQKPLT